MGKKRKWFKITGSIVIGICVCFFIGQYVYSFLDRGESENIGYWKAVHYFSDEWPLNFWNSEMNNISDELEQIKNDGFNSIILVVPWREFQPTMDPIEYNTYAFDSLAFVMTEAAKLDLDVFVRIGYTWDYYQDDGNNSLDRFYQLMDIDEGKKARVAWLDYAGYVYNFLADYSNFRGGFITWEDFWNASYLPDGKLGMNERLEEAEKLGYQKYLEETYSLDALNEMFNENFRDFKDIPVPEREDPMMRMWYEFYDDFLYSLLIETQSVFTNLSMEVRTDADVMYDDEGNMERYSHDATFTCGDAQYTAVMYGIHQGSENKGERLTAEQAINLTDIMFNYTISNNGKKIFAEQFLFYDDTPAFSSNAKLLENEIGKYLLDVKPVLEEYTCGYGIWTYRDYKSNMVYNSQFALGLEGWNTDDNGVKTIEIDGDNKVYLPNGAIIEQNIPNTRDHFVLQEYYIELNVNADEAGSLEIFFGDESKTLTYEKGDNFLKVSYNAPKSFYLGIKSNDDIYIDNIKAYNFIQNGKLYNTDGGELESIKYIRLLNSELCD